ncbi:hypothetical protein [Azospirillum lipoferum]|uniref:Uncharacterized protein n=1 Tax=Azospirillum lipoferum (strain 4B) TaxID=862719 RepID=G7ZHU1_AZOL4|nr:hypothetical protein [Azospirillum lipoferum]CBS91125.1 Protein of unknown function [Azospirillum lipoferum 4B]
MINIEATQVISYGEGQVVTVYRDFTDANTWYIVPEPVIPLDGNGIPEFSLVSYMTDKEVTGTCSFQTELQVSQAALQAVKAKLGADIVIGQFDWQSVKAVFHFATAKQAALELFATPSMYGSNRASFIIHLPDSDTYEAFKNAFGPGGSAAGTFVIEYDVTALTRLPPVTVTVEFDSQTAYDYQRTVDVSRDTWGHVTSETVSITEHLQQSKAGKITIDPGARPLDQGTLQLLTQWGNDTLQRDVEQAVAAATRMMGSNTAPTFNMTAVSSFRNVFTEGQIVPWVITPRSPIPSFSDAVWKKVSSSVSIRPMRVAFTVQNLSANGVESIQVMVNYPVGSETPPANNTFEFTPGGSSSWIFTAPGHSDRGVFDGKYSYHYVVNYADGSQPYMSGEIESDDSEIYISANDLKILYIEFVAENVAFKNAKNFDTISVDYMLIDLFFVNQATGAPLQFQQAKLDATNKSHVFKSQTHEPFANPCSYKLTYVLTSGAQVIVDWQTTKLAAPKQEGAATAPVVHLNSPFQNRTITLFPLAPKDQTFQMASISATYTDSVNNTNEQYSWNITEFSRSPEMWTFLAPANQNGQIVSFEGTYIFDNQPYSLQPAQTSLTMFVLDPKKPLFSVIVDPSQVEWEAGPYTQVIVKLYTKDDKGNISNIKTLIPFHKGNSQTQLYTYYYDASKTPVCYYTAEYWIKDQPAPAKIAETDLSATGQLTLFGKPPQAALTAADKLAQVLQSGRAEASDRARMLASR